MGLGPDGFDVSAAMAVEVSSRPRMAINWVLRGLIGVLRVVGCSTSVLQRKDHLKRRRGKRYGS